MENSEPGAIMILIGNKSELNTTREVTYKEGVNFMKEKGFHFFFETSAAKGENVELAFLEAAKLAYITFIQEGDYQPRQTIKLKPCWDEKKTKKNKDALCDLSKQQPCNCQ